MIARKLKITFQQVARNMILGVIFVENKQLGQV